MSILDIHHYLAVYDPPVPSELWRSGALPGAARGPKVLATKPCRKCERGERQIRVSFIKITSWKFLCPTELYICLLAFKYLELWINQIIFLYSNIHESTKGGQWEISILPRCPLFLFLSLFLKHHPGYVWEIQTHLLSLLKRSTWSRMQVLREQEPGLFADGCVPKA